PRARRGAAGISGWSRLLARANDLTAITTWTRSSGEAMRSSCHPPAGRPAPRADRPIRGRSRARVGSVVCASAVRGAGTMVKAAVMGAGSFGTAFAKVLADAGTEVVVWARRAEVAESITTAHRNPSYMTDTPLPASVTATSDHVAALAGADIVVLAVPSQTLRENLARWSADIPATATLVSLAKGIETGSLMRMSQVI